MRQPSSPHPTSTSRSADMLEVSSTGFDPVYISDAEPTPRHCTHHTLPPPSPTTTNSVGNSHIPVAEITPTQWRFKQTSGLFFFPHRTTWKFHPKVRCSNLCRRYRLKNLWDAGSWTTTALRGTYGSAIRVVGVNHVPAGSSFESAYSYTPQPAQSTRQVCLKRRLPTQTL